MSDWALVFLGVIAAATLVTAVMQVVVLVAAGALVRRVRRFVDVIEQEVKPFLGHMNSIGRDASRAASLAAAQVERVDRALATLVQRLEEALATFQTAVGRPAREAAALVAGIRAALAIIQDIRARRARRRADEDEALFI